VIFSYFSRRRADRFAQLLDAPDKAEVESNASAYHHDAHDPELEKLLHLGRQLRQQMPVIGDQVRPDPDFRARLRQQLMDTAAARGIGVTATQEAEPDDAPQTTSVRRPGLRLGLAFAALAALLGLTGVSAASGDALPGEALYGVKRQTERAQLALAGSDVNRGQLHLEFARTRLAEAVAIADNPRLLPDVLDDMDEDSTAGVFLLTTAAVDRGEPSLLDAVDAFTSQQLPEVADLADTLEGEFRQRALTSLDLLNRIQDRSAELRRLLPCTSSDSAEVDDLGPLPQRCSALPATDEEESSSSENRDSGSQRGNDTPDTPDASPGQEVTPTPSDTSMPPSDGLPATPTPPSILPSPSTVPPSSDADSDDDSGFLEDLLRIIGDLLGR